MAWSTSAIFQGMRAERKMGVGRGKTGGSFVCKGKTLVLNAERFGSQCGDLGKCVTRSE